MNKSLSLILLDKFSDASYLDRTSGVVQIVSKYFEVADGGPKYEKKIPYATSATLQDLATMAQAMIPNSAYKSCMYFEDQGILINGQRGPMINYVSRMRLVCWLNMIRVLGYYDSDHTAKIMGDVIGRLTGVQNFNADPFSRITVTIGGIAQQNAQIFSDYSYDEREGQYLMPPYDFFAIDITVNFWMPAACLPVMSNEIITP